MPVHRQRCSTARVGVRPTVLRFALILLVVLFCLSVVLPHVVRAEEFSDDTPSAALPVEAGGDDYAPILPRDGVRGAAEGETQKTPAGEGYTTAEQQAEFATSAGNAAAGIEETSVSSHALPGSVDVTTTPGGDEAVAEPSPELERDVDFAVEPVASPVPNLPVAEGVEDRALCDATAVKPPVMEECDDGTYPDQEESPSSDGESVKVTDANTEDVSVSDPLHAEMVSPPDDVPLSRLSNTSAQIEDTHASNAAAPLDETVTLTHEAAQSSLSEPAASEYADDLAEVPSFAGDVPQLSTEEESALDVDDVFLMQEQQQQQQPQQEEDEADDVQPAAEIYVDAELTETADDDATPLAVPTAASSPERVEPLSPEIFTADDRVVDEDAATAIADHAPSSHLPPRAEEEEAPPVWRETAAAAAAPPALAEEEATYVGPTASTDFTEAPRSHIAPPSRHALSYLYYHALEALYVEENTTLFVHRARDAAPYGHARLNWLLGVLHAYGIGVPRSERDALMYYSFAAMEGVPEAHMALGYRYRGGLGVRASCETALAHYREAADAVAMTYDGSAADLEGRAVSETTGSRTLASGAASGMLSFLTYRDNVANTDRARQMQQDMMKLLYQADEGSAQALLTLGYVYLKGNQHVRRDGRKAEGYLKQAAAKGVSEAHGALGNLYTAGDATIEPPMTRDLARAYHHYRVGALLHDAVSLNGIGYLHAIGFLEEDKVRNTAHTTTTEAGLHPSDFTTAARYFEQSRSPESMYNLAVLHLYGRGVRRDRAAAQSLFWSASKGGSVLARWQLAHLLEEGMEHNPGECVKALELYRETASFGSWHRGDGAAANAALASRFSAAATAKSDGEEGSGEANPNDGAAAAGEATTVTQQRRDNANGDDHDGPSAPRTSDDYARLLAGILGRLQAVEERLRRSDAADGPAFVSLASFVELLSLSETGDGASTWLAAQYVENFLEVAGEEGSVALLWPADTESPRATGSDGATSFLSPAAARSTVLYYLLQRSVLRPGAQTHAHGAAYLRLGDLFYYGEVPYYGVDMARAMEYYRLAADTCHDPQALFNVGFMYQLGLHHAPRVTLVSAANFAAGRAEDPETLWKVHSEPPLYLTGAPSFYLAGKAAAHAWNRDSTSPMSRGVDVYLAWRYYTESLRREGRGWMAVRFALLTLNAQWSLRHFGLQSLLSPLTAPSLSQLFSQDPPPPVSPPSPAGPRNSGDSERASAAAVVDGGQDLLESLTVLLHTEVAFIYAALRDVAAFLVSMYVRVEQVVLYGAVAVFALAMLIRHHAV